MFYLRKFAQSYVAVLGEALVSALAPGHYYLLKAMQCSDDVAVAEGKLL